MVARPAVLDPPHALVERVTMLIVTREGDRVGDSRVDYSQKHRRHGVNVQVVTDPAGRLLWISPALPGRAHDLTAARTHRIIRIIRICERQGVPALVDRAHMEAAPWVTTPLRRPPGRDRIFRKVRCSPNRMSSITAAILILERHR